MPKNSGLENFEYDTFVPSVYENHGNRAWKAFPLESYTTLKYSLPVIFVIHSIFHETTVPPYSPRRINIHEISF